MSQGKFLSEDDIRSFINESLNLKLDREAFLKPNSEIVCEIYARFLDLTLVNKWRKSYSNGFEPSVKANMNAWLRHLFEPYNVGFEFNYRDIVAPTRKRTMAFLNIIIHVRLMIEEAREVLQGRAAEWNDNNIVVKSIEEEIEQQKLLRDELALKKGSMKSSNELQELKKHLQKVFDEKNVFCEQLSQQGGELKRQEKESDEADQKSYAKVDALKQRLTEEEDLARRLDDGLELEPRRAELELRLNELKNLHSSRLEKKRILHLKIKERADSAAMLDARIRRSVQHMESTKVLFEKINREKASLNAKAEQLDAKLIEVQTEQSKHSARLRDSELIRDKARIQFKIKQESARTKLSERRSDRSKKEGEDGIHSEEIEKRLIDIKSEQNKVRTELKNNSDEYAALLEKMNRIFETQAKRYHEALVVMQRSMSAHRSSTELLEAFIGKPKENETQVNRTYTKEKPCHKENTYLKENTFNRENTYIKESVLK